MRASYKTAVQWIADNDNGGNGDTEDEVRCYVTTALVADVFGKCDEQVARDVMRARRKQEQAQ